MNGDVPEQVRHYAPKKNPAAANTVPPHNDGDLLDQSGEKVIALLRQAAIYSNEACDRANRQAGELSLRLHAAEDRINQLQAQIEQVRARAVRAEQWLVHIYDEIEEKFFSRTGRSQQAPNQ